MREGRGHRTTAQLPSVAPGDSEGVQRARLSRDRVVRTALRLMDEEGLEAVTMRRIGRELGVEAMSLYNHVRDKDDVLEGICEAVMAEFRWEPPSEHWVARAREAAREWRRLLKAHPTVMRLLVERKHPLTSPVALRPMEIALDTLQRAGLSERDAAHAFEAIGGYLFGFVMMEVGNLAPGPSGARSGEFFSEDLARSMGQECPCLMRMLPWLAECDMDVTFEFGLDLLLEGIRAKGAAT